MTSEGCPAGLTCNGGFCGQGSCPGTMAGTGEVTETWVGVSSGLQGAAVSALAVDAQHPATVYAGTAGGVWKTINGAANWIAANTGLPQRAVRSLAIDPLTTTTIYAGLDSAGVYKSTDAAATWTPMNNGPAGMATQTVYALALHPRHAGYVFAGLAGPAVYVSSDGGTSWNDVSTGIIPYGPETRSFAFDSDDRVYAATFGSGLYRMGYNAQTWTAVGGMDLVGTGRYMNAIIDSGQGFYLATDSLAALYRSDAIGSIWTAVAGFTGRFYALGVRGNRLYLGGATGVDIYDGTVVSSTLGLSERVNALALDPTSAEVAYAGTDTGIYKTTDGTNWAIAVTGLVGNRVTALAIDPRATNTLYVGLQQAGLFRSTDRASSWSPPAAAGNIPPLQEIYALAVDQVDSGVVWAGTSSSAWRSADRGVSWVESLPGRAVTAVASSAGPISTVYAGLLNGPATNVYVNTAAGGWLPAASGLPSTMELVSALAVSQTDPMKVFAAVTDRGIYTTANGGALWATANAGLGSLQVLSLAMNPAETSTLYAGTFEQGVWKTTDGMNWSASSNGLTSLAVTAVAIAGARPTTIYLGTRTNGVFRSTNSGTVWTNYSTGLGSLAITQLVVDPTDADLVYAGTWDGGVFRTMPR